MIKFILVWSMMGYDQTIAPQVTLSHWYYPIGDGSRLLELGEFDEIGVLNHFALIGVCLPLQSCPYMGFWGTNRICELARTKVDC